MKNRQRLSLEALEARDVPSAYVGVQPGSYVGVTAPVSVQQQVVQPPTLIGPVGAVISQGPTTFSWTPVYNATLYEVQIVDLTAPPISSDTRIIPQYGILPNSTTFMLNNMVGHTVEWRVRAFANNEFTAWSDYSTFTLQAPPPPPVVPIVTTPYVPPVVHPAVTVPTLSAPVQSGYQFTLHWTAVPKAYRYEVQVVDATTGRLLSDTYASSNSQTSNIVGLGGHTLAYRVRAFVVGEPVGAWSPFFRFADKPVGRLI